MDKELKDVLKLFCLALVFGAIMVIALCRIHSLEKQLLAYENMPADTVFVDRTDTVFVDNPVPVYKYISKTEFVEVVKDSIVTDTIHDLVFLPREIMVYKDSTYRAVVSGVEPRLDSLQIYQKTRTEIVTKTIVKKQPTRWGVGVQIGVGVVKDKVQPYFGAGVQYNLITW